MGKEIYKFIYDKMKNSQTIVEMRINICNDQLSLTENDTVSL